MANQPSPLTELKVRTNYSSPNLMRTEKVDIKKGPRTYKTASLMYFGDKRTGEIKSTSLQMQSYRKQPDGHYDFDNPDYRWYCEDGEIQAVQGLLNAEFPDTGTYQLVKEDAGLAQILKLMEQGAVQPEAIVKLIELVTASKEVGSYLAKTPQGQLLATAIQLQRQKDILGLATEVIETAESTETDIQKIIGKQAWLFGGRYIGVAKRRGFTVLDQVDIPLLRADGSLHIVELKRANIEELVRKHRNHYIVGDLVHEAVSQAQNYLRSLDEQRATILTDLGVDCRRSSATVVIGHPMFTTAEEALICEALRTYNAHLSRVEVITYKELLDGAARALSLSSTT